MKREEAIKEHYGVKCKIEESYKIKKLIDDIFDAHEAELNELNENQEAQLKVFDKRMAEIVTEQQRVDRELKNRTCEWTRAFDQNFNISCVNETGERANGNFKGKDIGAKWEFIFCPYCGGKIEEVKDAK